MADEIIERIKEGKAKEEKKLEKDVTKPWGGYVVGTSKILIVDTELSVQSHKKRDELWYVVKGNLLVYRGLPQDTAERTISMLALTEVKPGDAIFIPRNTVHTAVNVAGGISGGAKHGPSGKADSDASTEAGIIAEFSYGVADEDDIIRYYDKNGRVKLEGYPSGTSVKDLIKMCKERLWSK